MSGDNIQESCALLRRAAKRTGQASSVAVGECKNKMMQPTANPTERSMAQHPEGEEQARGDAPSGATATLPHKDAPDEAWRVLQSGALAHRLPPAHDGKEVWLDAQLRVKLCEHGHSAAQIAHWNCTARPRPKPEWTGCDCTSMSGLSVNPRKPRPELPEAAPEYHRVLWRDHEPALLEPVGVLAVRVPGNPKGREVYLDAEGRARCPHGLTAGAIALREERNRRHARGVKPRPTKVNSAADVDCGCSAKGLRLQRFGCTHRHWASAVRKKEDRRCRIERQREELRRQYQRAQAEATGGADAAEAVAACDPPPIVHPAPTPLGRPLPLAEIVDNRQSA